MRVVLICFVGALVWTSHVHAQPEPAAETLDPALTPLAGAYDPTTCKPPEVNTKPTPKADSDQVKSIPISLTDFEITGELVDPAATVRALLAPTIQAHNVLSEDLRTHARDAAAAIGYHLVGLGTRETPGGKHAVLALQPMPMIRKAEVDIDQKFLSVFDTPLFEESVKRRIQLRPGTYLPWDPLQSACEMQREQRRIEEYLQSEGYFDASAIVVPKREGNRVTIVIRVKLGSAYKLPIDDKHILITNSARLPVDPEQIREAFRRKRCVFRESFLCVSARFTKLTHTAGIEKVTELFHRSQYPGVRVNSTKLDWDRASHTVKFRLTIEPRRKVDVAFKGIKPVADELLAKQLTFNKAQSADDVEAEASARAIAAYLQTRGFFEARVTWYRDSYRNQNLDLIVFQIDAGASRTVRQVIFKGSLGLSPDRRKAEAQLLDAIATKPIGTTAKLLGAKATATSADLIADVGRISNLYKRIGYRDARVTVSAATTPIALGSAALTAALLLAERNNDIYVQFAIDAGLPTLLTQVSVVLGSSDEIKTPEQLELCREVLKDLAVLHSAPSLAQPVNNIRCIGTVTNQAFHEGDLAPNRDALKQLLFARARPRADVEVEWKLGSTRRAHVRYVVKNPQQLKIGKVVLRGNFRTRDSIIRGELVQANFREGQPLSSGALAEATRRLRNTGLFETTNIQLLDIDKTTAGSLNTVVEVTERYDYPIGLEANVGYSSFNGVFVSLLPSLKNWLGTGISLDTQATVGFDPSDAADGDLTFKQLSFDATLRIPQWISRRWHVPLQPLIEVNGFIRRQDTPRFGILRTTGVTTTLSRSRSFPRTETTAAHAVTGGFNYSYRLRARNVDALRPIGADDDDTQVPIDTTTGSVGAFIEWEHRNDRSGQLSPLAPEAGFRIEGQVSFAHPILSFNFGQDTFVKASGAGSKYWPLGTNLVLRVDGRYDHGFPLGGAALLPEVERYFGGGDSTIRGYEDDRLATELVEVAVPPLDNITQIRVLPAGGNIRAMFSADAQLRIYKLFSTALFFDAGLITNQWSTVTADDLRPAIGMALVRIVTPFGAFAWERAVPLRPRLGDDPRGRWHVSFAARAQF